MMSKENPADGVAKPEPNRFGTRLLFAIISLLAGEVLMATLVAGQPLRLYFVFASVIGWSCVGLLIVLPLASRIICHMAWPLVLLAGVCIGPLALAAMFVTTALLQAPFGFGLGTFSLSGIFTDTKSLWPMSSLISTVGKSELGARWGHANIHKAV